ncbi:MAG TPA: YlxR family protein [Candidatus Dormibacteraeota bacterium]|nr:YlxR family protein [Candidatus Dormibacteraeota bacterium]
MAAVRIPNRTCVGCRLVRPRSELVRLAVDRRGQVTLDIHNQLPGRGAYLCAGSTKCLEQARRRRALARSLRVGEDVINYEELGAIAGAPRREEEPSPR